MILKEWFQCPGCGHRNNIEWGGTDTEMWIDCTSCRRSVDVKREFDAGNLVYEDVEKTIEKWSPHEMCRCTPPVAKPHFEGCRFLCVKFAGSVIPTLTSTGLDGLKEVRRATVNACVSAFIYAAYGPNQQMSLNVLATKALAKQNAALGAYVDQAFTWMQAVVSMYYPLEEAISAATTPQEVMAVVFDQTLAPPDPKVTIKHALTL